MRPQSQGPANRRARFVLVVADVQTCDLAIDDLTELIIGCAMAVHSALGPGLLESVYRDCLVIELGIREMPVEIEVRVPIIYRGERVKNDLLAFLLTAKREGKTVAAYGAAAKGNTLMNYAGIRRDLISFVVDRNPAKQGKYMPGSRIPIVDEAHLRRECPDYIVILPWNLKDEVQRQLQYTRAWGAQLVVAVPALRVE